MRMSASSTGLTSVYSGSPLPRTITKSGTCSLANSIGPRTRSSQRQSRSGIRTRSTGRRPCARSSAACSGVVSRSALSYPSLGSWPAAVRRAATSSGVENDSYANPPATRRAATSAYTSSRWLCRYGA